MRMRNWPLALGLISLTVLTPCTAAVAATRTGTTGHGARFDLHGRRLSLRLPAAAPSRVRAVRAECGRDGAAGRKIAKSTRPYEGGRTIGFVLRSDVSRRAEWCTFSALGAARDSESPLLTGVASLRPATAREPAALMPGPGVRIAVTTDADGQAYGGYPGNAGDARFLLRDSTLTVNLRRGLGGAALVRAVCSSGETPEQERPLGYRTVVLPAGRRSFSVDLEKPAGSASSCLLEGTQSMSGDIVAAAFTG